MSKKILSEIEGFKGFVTFCEPLNLEQVFAIEDAQDKSTDLEPSAFLTRVNELRDNKDEKGETIKVSWSSRVDQYIIPAILKCVEGFDIEAFPENVKIETFPLTPRLQSQLFIDWLWQRLIEIYQGETTVPNES